MAPFVFAQGLKGGPYLPVPILVIYLDLPIERLHPEGHAFNLMVEDLAVYGATTDHPSLIASRFVVHQGSSPEPPATLLFEKRGAGDK